MVEFCAGGGQNWLRVLDVDLQRRHLDFDQSPSPLEKV
jgi:hypothetical protein